MYSQIGQTTSGHTSNPILAATGREADSRDTGAARDQQTFQSVLAGTERSTKEGRPNTHKEAKPDAEAEPTGTAADSEVKSTDLPDSDTTAIAADVVEDGEVGLPEFLASDADEIVFKEKGTASALTSDDVVELVARAARAIETAGSANETSTPEAAPKPQRDTGMPAWFATSRNVPQSADSVANTSAVSPTVTNEGKIEAQGAKLPSEINPQQITPSGRTSEIARAAVAPADDPTSLQRPSKTPGETTEASAGPVKQSAPAAGKVDNASTIAVPAPHRQALSTEHEPKHVTERRTDAETTALSFATRRIPTTSGANSQVTVAPIPAASGPALQELTKENVSVRWLSEVGFTSELSAQESPATSRVQQTTLLQQPDLPRNIAVQIAQAMRQGGAERPMELVLSPAELGRVRISMQAGDGAMTVHVMADRPETLDLMRRHIDMLAQEFHDIGFGTAEFAFGQNAPESDAQRNDDPSAANGSTHTALDPTENIDDVAVPTALTLQSDRVDIRL